jgi:alanine racemase
MTATATIDLSAFERNVRTLAAAAAPAATMVMLKADAYGHGIEAMAAPAVAAGAAALGVLEVDEGLRLRRAGIGVPLFAWLHGPATDFTAAAAHGIEVGVSSLAELRQAVGRPLPAPLLVHLKTDTGLHRNGATVADWPALVAEAVAAEQGGLIRIRGIFSHLADAGPEADAAALRVFEDAVAAARALGARPEVLHLAASSAGLYLPEARFDLVRFGIAAYGVSPFDDRSAAEIGVEPVMTLSAPVIGARGGTAVVGAGWGDGLHQAAVGAASALIGGRRRPITAMGVDTLVVGDADDVEPGAEAVLFGPGRAGEPTPADWAAWAGTIGDEILTRIHARVPRLHVFR